MTDRNFHFPYEFPYGTQLELMKEIYDTIENKKIGFFESPTGTGKTLTLLCGALTWLEDHTASIASKENAPEEFGIDEPEWIKKARLKSNESNGLDITEMPQKNINRSKKAKLETIITNVDDKIASLMNLLNENEKHLQKNDDYIANNFGFGRKAPKIIFCSRTHSQLFQVMEELNKTSFFKKKTTHSDMNLAVSTASRKFLCINSEINKLNPAAINEACQDLIKSESGCPYYNRQKHPAFKQHLDHLATKNIVDIEDFLKFGRSSQCCPYFSSRILVSPSSFIAAPYSAVLDKVTREAYGIDLKGSVVIFDEAHNIVDFIKQSKSFTISDCANFFKKVSLCIEDYLKKYSSRLRGSNSSALSQLMIFFDKMESFCAKTLKTEIMTVNDFIYSVNIDSFNFSRLLLHAEDTKLFTKVFDSELKSEINNIYTMLLALEKGDLNGKFIVSRSELKYVCINVIELMSDIVNECRSVVFCGGTMSPIMDTIAQLLSPDLILRTCTRIFEHIISPKNVNFSIITTGPIGVPLNFSYEFRNNKSMIKDLGMIVLNYARLVPDGLVVFFTSFSYMDEVMNCWKENRILENLNKIKKTFFERKGESVDGLLEEYELTIKKQQGGATIFAVMGGRLSEGINFCDSLGRCIITVGLPYPNAQDPEVREHINGYIKLLSPKNPGKSCKELESEFLEISCMKSINQTIGRAIRHKNDYAAIIMIDERANRDSIINRLPQWILPCINERSGKFDTSFKQVSKFFKEKLNHP